MTTFHPRTRIRWSPQGTLDKFVEQGQYEKAEDLVRFLRDSEAISPQEADLWFLYLTTLAQPTQMPQQIPNPCREVYETVAAELSEPICTCDEDSRFDGEIALPHKTYCAKAD